MFMIFLVYSNVSLFNCMICLCCPPDLRDIFHTPTVRYSLFVLKVLLKEVMGAGLDGIIFDDLE